MKIGVLALQGDFDAHRRALQALGAEPVLVRSARDLEGLAGLILPGGESTTMSLLLSQEGLIEPLRQFSGRRPVLGTCAGAILMASEVLGPHQESLGLIDMSVERNAYGRQVDSSIRRLKATEEFARQAGEGDFEAVLIRAPVIRRVGGKVTVLLEGDGAPFLVEQGRHMAATFHPELSQDLRVHRRFVEHAAQDGE